MIIRKLSAATVPVLAAALLGAGVANAEPATPDIEYKSELAGDTVVTTLTDGTFHVTGDTVDIRDNSGATVVTLPLSVRSGDTEFPLPHQVRDEGRVLELVAAPAVGDARPAAAPVASPQENLQAQNNFTSQFGMATAIGGFLGTALGAAIGLIGFVGGPLGFGAVAAGAALGGVIGTLVVGGPALIITAIDLVQTLTAPPGTTKWAE